jgi:ribonuclease E
MTMRMLIDARHREETRVAVVKGNRIEEFDFESVEHQQIKGNIYLAKVTRVEPSLQAAFVDYGGNRHGFLAFSEIHPDYYQIPKEDREALLREEAEHAAEEERLRDAAEDDEPYDGHHDDDGRDRDRPDADAEDDGEAAPESAETIGGGNGDEHGGGDRAAAEALRSRRMNLRRRYKIQDVIHRRQVLLVQVVKEERGNKGAALTTYLSLAGRYCVLMPNTTHGGGISRKISNVADRKRLKTIMADLNLPSTMGCIVRTAGLQRTKIEIKRDFDYLARLWDGIRETTLGSSAPAQIYTDSDLIRRAIRDIYNRDIDEVIVEGEDGFRAARDFMKLLMPSHARKVKSYADAVPLFQRHGVEDQLAAMYQPVVQLKSGGYLVINPTEALVSIDINSGRSTREHGIEATAVGTNLEAAHEIARQLRLRDMAGLVVIDFIDMENGSNVRKVEKAMKAALSNDRARIQVGRISSFGLMEMSRQRLRTGVLEASTKQCPHCEGTGLVRTASSAGLSALRMLEDEAARGKGSILTMRASSEAAFYLLNRKRRELAEIEARYGVRIEVISDGETEGARMIVEASGPPPAFTPVFEPIIVEDEDDALDAFVDDEDDEIEAEDARGEQGERDDNSAGGRKKRSRRRRGRRGRSDELGTRPEGGAGDDEASSDEVVSVQADGEEPAEGASPGETAEETRRRNRRGRRGGRRRREGQAQPLDGANDEAGEPEMAEAIAPNMSDSTPASTETADESVSGTDTPTAAADDQPVAKRSRTRRAKPAEAVANEDASDVVEAIADEAPPAKPKRVRKAKAVESVDEQAADDEAAPKPKRQRKPKAEVAAVETAAVEPQVVAPAPADQAPPAAPVEPTPAPAAPLTQPTASIVEAAAPSTEAGSEEPPRRGWWQRTFGE